MRPSRRFSVLFVALVFTVAMTAVGYAQTAADNAIAQAAIVNGQANLNGNDISALST